jgi:hypothetical protein
MQRNQRNLNVVDLIETKKKEKNEYKNSKFLSFFFPETKQNSYITERQNLQTNKSKRNIVEKKYLDHRIHKIHQRLYQTKKKKKPTVRYSRRERERERERGRERKVP